MRKFNFYFIMALALMSCKSSKNKLVELQSSMNDIETTIAGKMKSRAEFTTDSLLKAHPDWTIDSNFQTTVTIDTIAYYASEQIQPLVKKYVLLKKQFDSLGIETHK